MSDVPVPRIAAVEARGAWEAALATRANRGTRVAAGAQASRRPGGLGRRRFLVGALLASAGATLLTAGGVLLDFLYPRDVQKTGGPVAAGNVADYPRGAPPVLNTSGHFYLVNLDPADATPNGGGGGEGLLALWRKCPHLGCAVPWAAAFVLQEEAGWFRCPCHMSTYTKAGVRVAGPAPRSMDTMRVEVGADGAIIVHTDQITPGDADNAVRALKIPG